MSNMAMGKSNRQNGGKIESVSGDSPGPPWARPSQISQCCGDQRPGRLERHIHRGFSKGISLGSSMGIFAGFFQPPGDGKKWEASVNQS